jgi:hypothetical protein
MTWLPVYIRRLKCRSTLPIATGLLLTQAILLGYGACVHTPTLNEPGHLVAGISNWQFGRFDLYPVNPPLVRLVAALPPMAFGSNSNWKSFEEGPAARSEVLIGNDFIAANGERSFWLFTIARWACIPFSLLGGLICFHWAKELYGPISGLLAMTLWCFCPNVLGHGQLITPDVAGTALGLTACYTFWHWLQRPTWRQTILTGIVLGLSELAKTTLIVFFPLWPVMWVIHRWHQRKTMMLQDWLREAGMLAIRMLIGIYMINLGYLFEGSFTPLGDFQFVSQMLSGVGTREQLPGMGANRFTGTWLARIPVPLPKHYVRGIDLQKKDFESYGQPSYLRGHWRDHGWWYYYLYALGVKVPLGTWLLVLLAACAQLFVALAARWRDEFVLLCPAIVILVFVSSQTGFSEHMRYVLPAFPFVFVWIGRIAPTFHKQHWKVATIASLALTWSIGSSLWYYPHSLSYFNELVGGPKGGPAHLIHSNVDWGQDLLNFKRWLDENPEARPLKLAYFGNFDPIHAGIEYRAPEPIRDGAKIPPGWYAISVNLVRGLPCQVYKGGGSKGYLPQDALAPFQQIEPVAMAGYSIYIYHVPDEHWSRLSPSMPSSRPLGPDG